MKSNILILTLSLLMCTVATINAQVTIGSNIPPNQDALLDLKNSSTTSTKGLLLPRVALTGTADEAPLSAHVTGMTVYNTNTAGDVTPGFYYNDGNQWVRLAVEAGPTPSSFFYMPSIEIDLNATPVAIDLYLQYSTQFTNPKAKSNSASSIPVYQREELDYFVTDYDDAVFSSVSLTAQGVMTYTLQDPLPADVSCSYMNIVFLIK